MEFVGSNDKLGGEKIRLAGDRVAKPTQEKTALFPCGVQGMVPLSTNKKGGGTFTTFVFKAPQDLERLEDVIAQLNAIMAQAEELVDNCPLGSFERVRVGVKSPGYKFCHVEYAPVDKRGFAMACPVCLHVEEDAALHEPGDTSAVVEFDREGAIVRVAVDVYREGGFFYRLTAMQEEGAQGLAVHKGETVNKKGAAKLLYKRR